MNLDERTGLYILIAGFALLVAGYLWLVARAFRTRTLWGFVAILLAPVGGLVFAVAHFRKAILPLGVMLLGALATASPFALNKLFPPAIAPIENRTTGETDLTLTGMANFDYATLNDKPTLTVLQMANADVTDATLEYLKPMAKLRRLDLSGSAVTDAGLERLAGLPALEDVKLSRTKVTDAGIKAFLAASPGLKEITLTGTDVKTATLREWKNAKPDERKYVK